MQKLNTCLRSIFGLSKKSAYERVGLETISRASFDVVSSCTQTAAVYVLKPFNSTRWVGG